MNWQELEKEIQTLSEKIDLKPDIIVGIARGGVVPARLLSKFLNVKDMYFLTVKKNNDKREVVTTILSSLSNKNVLLVEDILETGNSLLIAQQYLEGKGASVKTVALYTLSNTKITPDYFLKSVPDVVVFPWE